ncbi:helix-turn-helix domain-containing protein [Enterococcus hirae]
MLRLIYENSLLIKIEIVQTILEAGGKMSRKELLRKLEITDITLEKYLKELYVELPPNSINFLDQIIIIDERKCSMKKVQIMYFSKSISKDILFTCLFGTKTTFERLSQELYVSPSKLFNVLKFLESRLQEINIQIYKTPYIRITGQAESILILYNFLLRMSDTPYEVSFSKMNKSLIFDKVNQFLLKNHITIEKWLVEELALWVIVINDRFFLQKFFVEQKDWKEQFHFLQSNSPLLQEIYDLFHDIDKKVFDKKGCLLLLLFFTFNIYSYHFENINERLIFYRDKILVKFKYQSFILSVLLDSKYNILISDIRAIALKLEGGIHFYNFLYPYFYFNDDVFNTKFLNSTLFSELVNFVKQDFEKLLESLNTLGEDSIYILIAYIISSFQKVEFNEPLYTVGIYSKKGGTYEEDFCKQLTESIRVVPFTKLCKEKVDLLIVDDLRLLNNQIDYKDYLLFTYQQLGIKDLNNPFDKVQKA